MNDPAPHFTGCADNNGLDLLSHGHTSFHMSASQDLFPFYRKEAYAEN
jgi:hypothetical protein